MLSVTPRVASVESFETLAVYRRPYQALGCIGSALRLVGPVHLTVTGWDRTIDLQLLSQCGSTFNCLGTSVPELH